MKQAQRAVVYAAIAVLAFAVVVMTVTLFIFTTPVPSDKTEVARDTQHVEEITQPPAPVTATQAPSRDGKSPDDVYFEKEVKVRLAQVADRYAEQIQYPPYSIPIPDAEALKKYLPNRSFQASRPLDLSDENGPALQLSTSKQQYFDGEDILATVNVTGLNPDTWVQVKGRLVESGTLLQATQGKAKEAGAASFQLRFTALDQITKAQGTEWRVIASASIDGKEYEIGSPVTYVTSIAEITYVDTADVRGEYLYIPVQITTSKPGYHELSANLYAADSQQPLIHLSAQEMIQTSSGTIPLKAHVSALKVQGHPGPYQLKDILLIRMPSPPTYVTEYGHSAEDSYDVNGFDLESYQDVPYVDEEARKRLEFLRQLGSVN